MLITHEFIERGMSELGGWNREQLKLLKVPWPPRKGWKRRIQGTEISEAEAEIFLKLRGYTKAKRKHLNELMMNFDADKQNDQ